MKRINTLTSAAILLLLFTSIAIYAQNPGGVNTPNLWLNGSGVTPDSGTVTSWADQMGTNTFTVSGDPQVSKVNFNDVVGLSIKSYIYIYENS